MFVFRDAVLVFMGAGIGGVCRWGIGIAAHSALGNTRLPLATFLANLLACALIGFLAGIALRDNEMLSVPVRLFLVTGFLGGMSTMSAFGLETVALIRRGDFLFAGANICLTLGVCLSVLWLLLKMTEA